MPRQLTIDKLGYEIAVKSIFNIQIEVLLTFFCFLLTIYCWSLQEVTVIDFFGETNYEPPTPPGGNKKETKRKRIFSRSDSNHRFNNFNN